VAQVSRRGFVVLAIGLLVTACSSPQLTSPPSPTVGPPAAVTPGPGEVPSANPTHAPSPPPGSITAEAAAAAAMTSTPGVGKDTYALWTEIEVNPFAPAGGLAWWVRLASLAAPTCPNASGTVPEAAPAGAPGTPCLDGEGGVSAVIDPVTGTLLGWGY
jgi:hypothetical protein